MSLFGNKRLPSSVLMSNRRATDKNVKSASVVGARHTEIKPANRLGALSTEMKFTWSRLSVWALDIR
ncbi:MAG: hypothetical protein AAFX39_11130 [Pseudomonadota bacterium]